MMLSKRETLGKYVVAVLAALLIDAAAQAATAQSGLQNALENPQPLPQAKNWVLSDEAVKTALETRLFSHVDLGDIKVQVNHGVATLSGKIPNEAAKRRTLRIANSTIGVQSTRDQLTVDPSLQNQTIKSVPDMELSKRVATKIAHQIDGARAGEDWWSDGWRVEGPYDRWNLVVDADHGSVNLSGAVPTVDIIKNAVEATNQVAGVRTVQSDLYVYVPGNNYFPPFYFGAPYQGVYYGRAYPYYPNVAPPHDWRPEGRGEGMTNRQGHQAARAR